MSGNCMRRLKRIGVAFPTGTCFGVRRALDVANRLLSVTRVYALHPLIHNDRALTPLYERGFIVVGDVEKIPGGSVVLLSAHGTDRDTLNLLKTKPIVLVDATCPLVKQVHTIAADMLAEGRSIVVVGDPDHIEIRALVSYLPSERYVLFNELDDRLKVGRLGVVFQTTYAYSRVPDVAARVSRLADDIRLAITICSATRGRQSVFDRLRGKYDAVVVVGGKNSANTGRLFRLARERIGLAWWVEAPEEIGEEVLSVDSLLILGGASTPVEHIAEVYAHIKAMIE